MTSPFGPTQLVALGIGPGSYRQFRFLAGEPESVWPAFQEGGAAIVSEPYAYRHGLAVGSVCGSGPTTASGRSRSSVCSPTTGRTRAWSC